MKRVYLITILTCLVALAAFVITVSILSPATFNDSLTVGFIYDNDESTAYTFNFSLARDAVEKEYGDRVKILTSSNVLDDEMEEPVREMANEGCDIIFFNGYSDLVIKLAAEYPNIQFCQTSYMDMSGVSVPSNYHTFKGEAYQGRYVSGIAAGLKMNQMISSGYMTPDQALVGFVAAFPTSEVISGYTAFLLGVKSIVPTARMQVVYTGTWSSYAHEKSAAARLIDNGCVIISQHTDTIGPAIACEEASEKKRVYHVGNSKSMGEVAPTSALVSSRICWEPYVLSAVEAVMKMRPIESVVSGNIHGNDVSAGFDRGWVEMIDLNYRIAAAGTQEAMDEAIEQFKQGRVDFVFKGDYEMTDADDPSKKSNLKDGYIENGNTSYPTFNYILTDEITILE